MKQSKHRHDPHASLETTENPPPEVAVNVSMVHELPTISYPHLTRVFIAQIVSPWEDEKLVIVPSYHWSHNVLTHKVCHVQCILLSKNFTLNHPGFDQYGL